MQDLVSTPQQIERLRLQAHQDAQRTRALLRRTAEQIKKSVALLANNPPPSPGHASSERGKNRTRPR